MTNKANGNVSKSGNTYDAKEINWKLGWFITAQIRFTN